MLPINDTSSIEEVLQYIVSEYGKEIYKDKQRLNNLIADLYTGEVRLKRLYRRMVVEDSIAQEVYAISLKPIQEQEAYFKKLVIRFAEANFLLEEFGKELVDRFLNGLTSKQIEVISTVATEEDGEWIDEFGVVYSKNRKKLIHGEEIQYSFIKEGTIAICDNAFVHCTTLKNITIPSSVTKIGQGAFWGCTNLTQINIDPNNKFFKSIDNVLFSHDLKTIIWFSEGIEISSYSIPKSVQYIGKGTFENCQNLTNITIPDSVTEIGDGAFYGCYNLTNITIPKGVTKIGNKAFACCGLTNITIPNSVTKIGDGAFDYTNLTQINVDSNNKFFKCINNILFSYDLKTIIRFSEGIRISSYSIPESVQYIGNGAFSNCRDLTNIIIPKGVTKIGDGAFGGCYNLTNIIIPKDVTKIGDGAFGGCYNLTNIIIPKDVTKIGNGAFIGCYNLINITIPKSVAEIGDRAFQGCRNLTNITIPKGVTEIGDEAFADCYNLTNIIIPKGVTEIGDEAFARCYNLTNITIPKGVTKIGDRTFADCYNLTNITIPKGVAEIGDGAFARCRNLTNITIPKGYLKRFLELLSQYSHLLKETT